MFGTDILMCRLMPFPIPCQITARGIACRGYKRPNKRSVRHDKGMMSAEIQCCLHYYDEGMTNAICTFIEKHSGFVTRLLNSFCLTHVRDRNTYVQTHTMPNSSSDNSSSIVWRRHKRLNKQSLRHHKGMTTVWRRINKATELFGCRNTVSFAMVWRRYDGGNMRI